MSDNVIYIQFHNKKDFPPGKWSREPDYCKWEHCGLTCVSIRDMTLGVWKGFVGVTKEHPAFNKSLESIFKDKWGLHIMVHGGISIAGKLPTPDYKDLNRGRWWFGFECSQGEDVMPLIQLDKSDPLAAAAQASQSYKDLVFVRKETNDLAKQIFDVKNKWEQLVL